METESDTSVVVDDKLRELQASIFVNFFYLVDDAECHFARMSDCTLRATSAGPGEVLNDDIPDNGVEA